MMDSTAVRKVASELDIKNGRRTNTDTVVEVPTVANTSMKSYIAISAFSGKSKVIIFTIWHIIAFSIFLNQAFSRAATLDFIQAMVFNSLGFVLYIIISIITFRTKILSSGDVELDVLLMTRREDYLVTTIASSLVYLLRIIVFIVMIAVDPNDTLVIFRNVMFLNLGVEIIYVGNAVSSLRSNVSLQQKDNLRKANTSTKDK